MSETQNADDDAPVTTAIFGDWNDTREQIGKEIEAVCDGTPDEIELGDGEVRVSYVDTDDMWQTINGGIDGDDLPVGVTFQGINIGSNHVTVMLNHRALE